MLPYSVYYKDELIMAKLPKHVVIKIKEIYCFVD